jgi:hypothetical protein
MNFLTKITEEEKIKFYKLQFQIGALILFFTIHIPFEQ